MRPYYYVHLVLLILLLGCKTKAGHPDSEEKISIPSSLDNGGNQNSSDGLYNNDVNSDDNEASEKYPDDIYCAEVEYHNPNTGTTSSYTLTVEVENNEIITINWPSGGWLDEDNFSGAELDEDGSTYFTSDYGYEYNIRIIGSSRNCFTNVPMARQCYGITKSGLRCKNMTDNPNRLCWHHQYQDNDNADANTSDDDETESQDDN